MKRCVPIAIVCVSMLSLGQTCSETLPQPAEKSLSGYEELSHVMMMNLAVDVVVVDEDARVVIGAPVYFNVEKKCFDDGDYSMSRVGSVACNDRIITDAFGRASFRCVADLRQHHVQNGVEEDYAAVEVTAYAPAHWEPVGGIPVHERFASNCFILGGLDRQIPIVIRLQRGTPQQ